MYDEGLEVLTCRVLKALDEVKPCGEFMVGLASIWYTTTGNELDIPYMLFSAVTKSPILSLKRSYS